MWGVVGELRERGAERVIRGSGQVERPGPATDDDEQFSWQRLAQPVIDPQQLSQQLRQHRCVTPVTIGGWNDQECDSAGRVQFDRSQVRKVRWSVQLPLAIPFARNGQCQRGGVAGRQGNASGSQISEVDA